MPRLMAPQPSTTQTVLSLPRQLGAAARWYRRTPERLRRREPAMRLGVSVVAVWFSVLFVGFGMVASRASATSATAVGGWVAFGYYAAAVLGPIGMVLFLTRRQRIGLYVLGSMLVLAQVVTLLSLR